MGKTDQAGDPGIVTRAAPGRGPGAWGGELISPGGRGARGAGQRPRARCQHCLEDLRRRMILAQGRAAESGAVVGLWALAAMVGVRLGRTAWRNVVVWTNSCIAWTAAYGLSHLLSHVPLYGP